MHAVAERRYTQVTQLLSTDASSDPLLCVPVASLPGAAGSLQQITKMNARALACNVPLCVWSKAVCAKTSRIIEQSTRWRPESHHLFPTLFRRSVIYLMLLQNAVVTEIGAVLPATVPKNVWFEIIGWLPRAWSCVDALKHNLDALESSPLNI